MMADKVGITPWEIRYRNAIRPGEVLPNGQIVDNSTGLVETLEAVEEEYDAALADGKAVGLGCAMKNAGVGVGIPDTGRVKLIVEEDEKLHIFHWCFLYRSGTWYCTCTDDRYKYRSFP